MIEFCFAMILITIGMYALILKDNLLKKIIGLGVMTDGIHLFLISLGFRGDFSTAIPPILSRPVLDNIPLYAVDPLPQALVLTSIVISVSVTAFAVMLAIRGYKLFGTLKMKEWRI